MEKFFNPDSVALIGVPRNSGPGSFNNLEVMLRYGFKGRIYAVHPKAREICGHRTYPAITELPETPDLAVISTGRDRVLSLFQQCAQKGVKNIIIISQGLADADEKGRIIQDELLMTARKNNIRFLGPNTMGILNAFSGFSTAFMDIPKDCPPPPLSLITQSGLFQVGFESFTERLGKAVDLGNCGDLDFVDALHFLETDPQTEIIVIHMEGLRRGRAFLETAARVNRKKPIIVFKTGRSSEGAKAAVSHTGSMAGEAIAFEKAFEKAGLVRVNNTIELMAASRSLLKFHSMKGPRLGIITATGAGGIFVLDCLEDSGLQSALLPETLTRQLESSRIEWHRLRNPLDIWPLGMVSGSFTRVFENAARLLIQEPAVDAVLGVIPVLSSPLHADMDMASCLKKIVGANTEQKPIAIFAYGDGKQQLKTEIDHMADVCVYPSADEAIMGLAATWRYFRALSSRWGDEAPAAIKQPLPGKRPIALPSNKLLLGEESFDLLRHYDIPLASGAVVKDPASAAALAERIGYPLALKILSPQWIHKSDMGGVKTNIRNTEALENAFNELHGRFFKQTPQGIYNGVWIQQQVQGMEMLFGIKRDPQFGPLVLAGFGGIYTEIFRDVSRAMVPVTAPEAREMIESLKCYPLLKGFRGQAGIDTDQLEAIILSLSRLATDYPEIEELDLNPVIVNEEGAWCVDSRIVFASYPARTGP